MNPYRTAAVVDPLPAPGATPARHVSGPDVRALAECLSRMASACAPGRVGVIRSPRAAAWTVVYVADRIGAVTPRDAVFLVTDSEIAAAGPGGVVRLFAGRLAEAVRSVRTDLVARMRRIDPVWRAQP